MQKPSAKSQPLSAVPRGLTEDTHTSEKKTCPLCFGTGLEIVEGKGARQCQCRNLQNQATLIERARLPKRYEDCHFHNYRPLNASQQEAFRYATRLTMEFPLVERGLLLMGSVGVGKTHLAVSILKGLTERSFACLFYEFGSLLKEIQDSYNTNTHTSELQVLAPVLNCDVLVLDELGGSKPTDWVRDTMAHIINSRYNEQKLTIFTTNYLDTRRSDRDETLEDRIGARLRSRIFEMCKTVNISGDDYRRTYDVRQ